MIQGLYEAHLPVRNLQDSIKFYQKLGLKLAWYNENIAFFWIEFRINITFPFTNIAGSKNYKLHTI